MASPRVRWECPAGEHPGVLGPRKPRRENIVRYCLPCSEREGKLVERIAPAVERTRTERADRAEAKRRAREQREAETEAAYYTVAGVNLMEEMKRLVRLKALGGRSGDMARRPPRLTVRRATRVPRSLYGKAWWYENRIQVVAYPGIRPEDVKEALLHELVHIYEGTDENGRCHGRDFQRRMREAFREAYGVVPEGAYTNRYLGRYAAALRGET